MEEYGYIRDNLCRVRETCFTRAEKLGLPVPRVIAVTKSATDEQVRALVGYGQDAIAENRASLFCERYDLFGNGERPEMHLIGQLQTNKVKLVIGKTALIQSLDSAHLAAEIEKQAAKRDITVRVLIEVNSGREEAKGGVMPEECEAFAETLAGYPHLCAEGLMTMAPVCESEDEYRPFFRETARLCRKLADGGLLPKSPILSMGMSGSYAVAVEEGATMVRVGRGLFQENN